jgi:hypothetical protein
MKVERLHEARARSPRELAMQMFAVLGAPIAWATEFVVAYAITQHACSTGHYWELHLSWIVFLSVALLALLVAARTWGAVRHEPRLNGGSAVERSSFVALLGLMTSSFFAVVIIAEAIPRFILTPCD